MLNCNKPILILGYQGQLGQEFYSYFNQYNNDFVLRTKSKNNYFNVEHSNIDITCYSNLNYLITNLKPKTIINCAAYNNTKLPESDIKERDKCILTNSKAVSDLAFLSKKIGATLVHFSSNYVFSSDTFYNSQVTEYDNPDTDTWYGKSKLWGEQAIRSSGCDYLILRTSNLYGCGKQNLIYKLLDKIKNNESITLSQKIIRPTACKDLVEQTLHLLQQEQYGLFNYSGKEIIAVNKLFEMIKEKSKQFSYNIFVGVDPWRAHQEAVLNNYLLKISNNNIDGFSISDGIDHYLKLTNFYSKGYF